MLYNLTQVLIGINQLFLKFCRIFYMKNVFMLSMADHGAASSMGCLRKPEW